MLRRLIVTALIAILLAPPASALPASAMTTVDEFRASVLACGEPAQNPECENACGGGVTLIIGGEGTRCNAGENGEACGNAVVILVFHEGGACSGDHACNEGYTIILAIESDGAYCSNLAPGLSYVASRAEVRDAAEAKQGFITSDASPIIP